MKHFFFTALIVNGLKVIASAQGFYEIEKQQPAKKESWLRKLFRGKQ